MANVVKLAVETVLGDSIGQLDRVQKKIEGVGTSAEKQSKKSTGWSKAWKVAAAGAVAGIGAVSVELDKSVRAAVAVQTSQQKLEKATTNAGVSWKRYGGTIDDTIKKQALLKGFQETDLNDSFQRLITVTGKVGLSTKLMGDAMDVSRATGIGLSRATILVAKVQEGSNTALQRYGIYLPKITAAQDALKAKTGTATAAQKAAAKAADATATAQGGLAALQQKFGGQADKYGKTAQGSMARYQVAVEQLQVSLGSALLPILTKVALKGAQLVSWFDSLSGRTKAWIVYGGLFVGGLLAAGAAVEAVSGALVTLRIATVAGTVAQWAMNGALAATNVLLDANPVALVVVGVIALGAAFVLAYKRSQTFRDIVNGTFNAVKTAAGAVIGFIRQHWQAMLILLTGAFGAAVLVVVNHWSDIKAAANHVVGFVVNRWGNIKQAFSTFGDWVKKYILGPIQWIIDKAKTAASIVSSIAGFFTGSGSASTAASNRRLKAQSGNAQANIAQASRMLPSFGWGQDQLQPLVSLWNQESGWSATAMNATSHAQGIPQLLPSQHPGAHPGFPWWPPVNAPAQIAWGLSYIKGRPDYGSPAAAWKHEQLYNWYDDGGVVGAGSGLPRGMHIPVMAAVGETMVPTHKRGIAGAGVNLTIHIHGADLSTPGQQRRVAHTLGGQIIRDLMQAGGPG